MIAKRTTLLLGAGASAHLGYPVGVGLRDEILRLLESNTVLPSLNPEDRRRFHDSLSMGGWSSPDAFLEHHPEFVNVGKWLIAYVLKKNEQLTRLFPPNDNGWYGILGNVLLEPTGDYRQPCVESFRENRLSIVTFNYDRSIDCFLHKLVETRLKLSTTAAWDLILETIPIVHVHGILGDYPSISYQIDGDIQSVSSGIKIVSEFEDNSHGFCTGDFRKANSLLNQAETVFGVGFSMAVANMKRLQFFDEISVSQRSVKFAVGNAWGKELEGTAKRVASFGITSTQLAGSLSGEFFRNIVSFE